MISDETCVNEFIFADVLCPTTELYSVPDFCITLNLLYVLSTFVSVGVYCMHAADE